MSITTLPERILMSWRFAAYVLALLLAYNILFALALLMPAAESAVGQFAGDFRRWCFGATDGEGVSLAYAADYFIGPVLVMAVVLLVWGTALRRAAKKGVARFFPWVGAAFATAAGVAVVLVLVNPMANANAGAIPEFPADTLRTTRKAADFELTAHDGAPFKLSDYEGRVVLITGIYTRCGADCPMIFQQLKGAVERLSTAEKAQLSVAVITLDPEADDVAAMAERAEFQDMHQPLYSLLSGTPADVNAVLDKYGFERRRNPETGVLEHNNLFILVDRDGSVAYTLTLGKTQEEWLAEALRKLLAEHKPEP